MMGEEKIDSKKTKRHLNNDIISIWLVMLILFFGSIVLNKLFDIPFFKNETNPPIVQPWTWAIDTWIDLPITWNTRDVSVVTWISQTGLDQLTWLDIDISDIDKVYGVLENWKPWVDYSIITPNQQNMKYSTSLEDDLKNYLANNIFSVTMPADIKWWYLYIKLKKPLKYMPTNKSYQPVTIKTNIYFQQRLTYWRLITQETLPIYQDNQEFLYDLSYVPVRGAKWSNRLAMKWKKVQIGWFVSDTQWNYIEKIIFIWER